LLVLGALGMWICGAWMYHGGQRTSATNMALIYAVTPIAIAVVGARLLHERMRPRQWAAPCWRWPACWSSSGRATSIACCAVRFGAGDGWIVIRGHLVGGVLGAAQALASGARARRAPGGHLRGGLLVMLPFTCGRSLAAAAPPLGWQAAGLVLAAAVLPGVLSYGAYSFLQRELGAARTALMLYLTPVYAPLLAWGAGRSAAAGTTWWARR
jgi:drug/metabolite transporter (DMT)-like permease